MSTRHGTCRIIGARDKEIWYSIENSECPNWYWTPTELTDLFNFGVVERIDEDNNVDISSGSDGLLRSILRTTSSSTDQGKNSQLLSYQKFEEFLLGRQWNKSDDEELVNKINQISCELNLKPTRLPRMPQPHLLYV